MSIETSGKTAPSVLIDISRSSKHAPKNQRSTHTVDAGTSPPTDKINVTPMATKLNDLTKQISASPIMDTHRVNTIKHDIEHGSYVVNSSRVAEKFFRFEFALHR